MFRTRAAIIIVVLFAVAFLSAVAVALRPAMAAEPPVYTGLVKGVAVGGYDPVAYFTDGKPVQGKSDITLEHQGATWRFANAANREAFKAAPDRYAPQYGGYCAWAVSQGYTAKGDPNAWAVQEGKLYLNYNKSVQRDWAKDIAGNVKKADANWPEVLAKK
jgi:YHS domain-containing protein